MSLWFAWIRGALLLGLLSSSSALASFLPKNDLHLEDRITDENMTEARFHQIIDKVEAVYTGIVHSHGAKLEFSREWVNGTVNAYAYQSEDRWVVALMGGLARRPEITDDGFALVICHELGHHLGGFPFGNDWSAIEGQSDYFATQTCAREIWRNDLAENAAAREAAPTIVRNLCDDTWQAENDRNLCYRVLNASKSLADLFNVGPGFISFATPDTTVVAETLTTHPPVQCRLDTFLSGALCDVAFDRDLIPGKAFIDRNGANAELEAIMTSCSSVQGHEVGIRPRCWFAPRI